MLNKQAWTFVKIGPHPAPTSGQAAAAVSATPSWALAVVTVLGVGAVAGVGVGTAAATGAFAASAAIPPPPPLPPSPPPPYNSDDASAECSNDCTGCAQNGGCTYSYGADGDPNTQHDSRAFQSNGICDDGGEGSTLSVCDFGKSFHSFLPDASALCHIHPSPFPPSPLPLH